MGRLENDVFSTCRYRFCQFFGCRCEFDQFALGLDTGVDGLLLLDFKTLVEAQFNTHPICCLLFVGLPFLAHFGGCCGCDTWWRCFKVAFVAVVPISIDVSGLCDVFLVVFDIRIDSGSIHAKTMDQLGVCGFNGA